MPVTVQSWPGLPSQGAMVMGVLLAAESPVSATHLPARYPDTIGPETGPAAEAGTRPAASDSAVAATPAVMAAVARQRAGVPRWPVPE